MMQTTEIMSAWSKDCEIDVTDLAEEARKCARMHSKYYGYFLDEHRELRKLRANLKRLNKLKIEYYDGSIAEEDLKRLNWRPFQKRILNSQMKEYIDMDEDMIKYKLKIGEQEEKVSFLESIIKQIMNRNFLLKTALDFEKFRAGAY